MYEIIVLLFAMDNELTSRSRFIFICFSAGTATAKDLQTIFITRFFAGVMASARTFALLQGLRLKIGFFTFDTYLHGTAVTTVGGGLADMFDQKERGA